MREPIRSKLTPDFAAGCKRTLLSNDYYETLEQDNVELVTTPIRRLSSDAVVTAENSHQADAVIFATGFRTSDLLVPMKVVGRDGRRLADEWRTGRGTYLGILSSGFPNFFMLYGPNTNLGHNSIIFMVECQVNYIVKCLQRLMETGLQSLEVREDAVTQFSGMVQERLKRTVWNDNCTNWYKTDTGRMINNWCASTVEYWLRTRRPDFSRMVVKEVEAPQHVAIAIGAGES